MIFDKGMYGLRGGSGGGFNEMFIDIFLNGEMSEFFVACVIAENEPKRVIGDNELFVIGIFKGEFFDIVIDELSDFNTRDERTVWTS